jgi:hypothetical protein
VIQSFEPGESWVWCYLDEAMRSSVPTALDRSHD